MDLPVFCHFDEMVPVAEIRENPDNPNVHPDSQIAALAEVLRRNGWRSPVTVSRRSGLVVKGHGRIAAARALGLEAVPVAFQDYETEADEISDLVADNRIAELSELDLEKVDELADRLGLEAERMGFFRESSGALDKTLKDSLNAEKEKAARSIPIMILATQEEAEDFDRVKAELGVKSDDVVFSHIFKEYMEARAND